MIYIVVARVITLKTGQLTYTFLGSPDNKLITKSWLKFDHAWHMNSKLSCSTFLLCGDKYHCFPDPCDSCSCIE